MMEIDYRDMHPVLLGLHITFYKLFNNPYGASYKQLYPRAWSNLFMKTPLFKNLVKPGQIIAVASVKKLSYIHVFPPIEDYSFLDSVLFALLSMKSYMKGFIVYAEIYKDYIDTYRKLRPFKLYYEELRSPRYVVPGPEFYQVLYSSLNEEPGEEESGDIEPRRRIMVFDNTVVDELPCDEDGTWRQAYKNFFDGIDEGQKVRIIFVCNLGYGGRIK